MFFGAIKTSNQRLYSTKITKKVDLGQEQLKK